MVFLYIALALLLVSAVLKFIRYRKPHYTLVFFQLFFALTRLFSLVTFSFRAVTIR